MHTTGVRNFLRKRVLCCLLVFGLTFYLVSNYLTHDLGRLVKENDHNEDMVKYSLTLKDNRENDLRPATKLITEVEGDTKDTAAQLNKEIEAVKSATTQLSKNNLETRQTTDGNIRKTDNLTLSTAAHKLGLLNNDVISIARNISLYNDVVMVTVVNDAFLPFAYSWLCNTRNMGIHKSVLVITGDNKSKENLTNDWPEVNVFVTDIGLPNGNQEYSHVGYIKIIIRRTQLILSLLLNNIDVLLFEFDYTWFANPLLEFQAMAEVDMLVNPVSAREGVFNGGLVYLFATERTRALWRKLTEMMVELGDRVNKEPDDRFISEAENDQQFMSSLVNQRYGDIRTKVLPLDKYSDGVWYKSTESERNKTHPVLISNNWIIGNKNKMSRAKEWKHWFVKEDNSCDDELVRKTVYT